MIIALVIPLVAMIGYLTQGEKEERETEIDRQRDREA